MEALKITRELFDFMNENIPYCHWKSTEHIKKTLSGDTDVDVLIDREYKNELIEVLFKIGFIRFEIPQLRDYVAVEDYLGFDKESGKIVHLHLHYQLTLGEKHLKGSRLPIEKLLIDTRKYLKDEQVYVIDENLEAVMFMARFVIKLRKRDFIKTIFGKKYISHGSLLEYKWLKERASKDKMTEYAETIFDRELANKIVNTFYSNMSVYKFYALRKSMSDHLSISSMYSKPRTLLERYRRELFRILEFANKKTFNASFYFRRRLFSGGLLVAFVGVDGAGKSSIVSKVKTDFSKEMNVHYEYLGSGLGQSSFMRLPLKLLYRLLITFKIWDTKKGSDSLVKDKTVNRSKKEKIIKQFGDLPWTFSLTMERKNKLKKVMANRNRGFLVVTDRYPQNNVDFYHDGKRLAKNKKSKIYNWVRRYEDEVYNLYGKYTPDLVIRILVDPEIAYSRKPNEITIDGSREAQKLLRQVVYEGAEVVEIYNNGSFEETINKVKQIIWERI